jgi:hypothetical protein
MLEGTMSDKSDAVYLNLDTAGLPPAIYKVAKAEFDKMAAARERLAEIANAHSKTLRSAGKIPATHEIAFAVSRFGGTPQVVVREMRAAKVKSPGFTLA